MYKKWEHGGWDLPNIEFLLHLNYIKMIVIVLSKENKTALMIRYSA